MLRKWLELVGFVAIALVTAGCSGTGVGDACVPEEVPIGGFLASETYLETNSVQCATRVCLVRGLQGDPNNLQPDCPLGDDETCRATEEDVEESVYCSCRCADPSGTQVTTQSAYTSWPNRRRSSSTWKVGGQKRASVVR